MHRAHPTHLAVLAALVAVALFAAPVQAGPTAGGVGVHWLTGDAAAFERARSSGKPVLVDFWADWCGACAVMEQLTFADLRVQAALRRFEAARLDGSEGSAALATGRFDAAAAAWGAKGLPTVVLLDPRGQVLDRIAGVVGPEPFLDRLEAAERRCRASGACR